MARRCAEPGAVVPSWDSGRVASCGSPGPSRVTAVRASLCSWISTSDNGAGLPTQAHPLHALPGGGGLTLSNFKMQESNVFSR